MMRNYKGGPQVPGPTSSVDAEDIFYLAKRLTERISLSVHAAAAAEVLKFPIVIVVAELAVCLHEKTIGEFVVIGPETVPTARGC